MGVKLNPIEFDKTDESAQNIFSSRSDEVACLDVPIVTKNERGFSS